MHRPLFAGASVAALGQARGATLKKAFTSPADSRTVRVLSFPFPTMPFRTRLLPVTLSLLSLWLAACSASSDADRAATKAAEADRLYSRANDYVSRVVEGRYSYAYLQFYWKRAQANIDRIQRSYADTPTGSKLKAGDLKLGPYELSYFKQRVLPWVEVKRLASVDAVNCAIFLYNIDEKRWDEARLAAFADIIEVLSRQQRWAEAQIFPILPEHQHLLQERMFRIAARFHQEKIAHQLLASASPTVQAALFAIQGECLAIRGVPRTEIAAFLEDHPDDAVKLGVLSGMIQRELKIQRAAALRTPTKDIIIQGGALEEPTVRDDVDASAARLFPAGSLEASRLLAEFRAALGNLPAARQIAAAAGLRDSTGIDMAWLDYLAAFERYDELTAFPRSPGLSPEARKKCQIKTVELLARSGQTAEAQRALDDYLRAFAGGKTAAAEADAAVLQWFRGRMSAVKEQQLVVNEHTFADLPIKDPCLMAQAIMEWSLTPNRDSRGAAPWDPVITRYAGGFENLPEPRSKDVQQAAAESKPF